VAGSYNNIGLVHYNKGEYDKALENYQKALAIDLKQLGPEDTLVAISYNNMAFVYKAKKDLAKAKEYWEKAYAICLKKLGPNHPTTKRVKAQLDALKE
jgi:tetratricopeptide (TPR) repeat protein